MNPIEAAVQVSVMSNQDPRVTLAHLLHESSKVFAALELSTITASEVGADDPNWKEASKARIDESLDLIKKVAIELVEENLDKVEQVKGMDLDELKDKIDGLANIIKAETPSIH